MSCSFTTRKATRLGGFLLMELLVLFELHNVGGAADSLVNDDAKDNKLFLGGDTNVGEALTILQVGLLLKFVHHLLLEVVATKEVEVDAGLSLSLNSSNIGEVGGGNGGTIANGGESAIGDAAGHGESHCNNGNQS